MLGKLKSALKNLETKVEQTKENMMNEQEQLTDYIVKEEIKNNENNIEQQKKEDLQEINLEANKNTVDIIENISKEENEKTVEKTAVKIEAAPVVASYKVEKTPEQKRKQPIVSIETYKLHELIATSLKQFAPLIVKKGIRIELDSLDCSIKTNQEVMLFIFQEIISNAINHMVEGVLSIYLLDGHNLVIQDTGDGIPKDELASIFEEGFIASNVNPTEEQSGIGLYKCAIALEKMNYEYEVQSILGKGTAFMINLNVK